MVIFTQEANEAAVQEQAKATVVKAKVMALTTAMGSFVLRKGKVTQTAEIDFVLQTVLVYSEGHAAHVSLVTAFADEVGIDLSAKGKTAKARLTDHIVKKEMANIDDNGTISIKKDEIDFWIRSVESSHFKEMIFRFAKGIADYLGIEANDYDLVDTEGKRVFVRNAYYGHCIDAAVVLNKEYNAKVKGNKKGKKVKVS